MSIVEALVALALAAVAVGGLAATGTTSVRAVVQARRDATAIALATERLEVLRGGPRTTASDTLVTPDGTRFTRTWRTSAGRGHADRLDATITWDGRRLDLDTAVWP